MTLERELLPRKLCAYLGTELFTFLSQGFTVTTGVCVSGKSRSSRGESSRKATAWTCCAGLVQTSAVYQNVLVFGLTT